ncbi:hypothetical protein [Paenibacillus thiaminolyticus]|nr:hypothetical protein [Paenibacillus thiaminolyticus]
MFGFGVGVCKVCGCIEEHACVTENGPCSWANEDEDLCSACVPVVDFYPQMHFYQCSSCKITFGIDARLEEQSSANCPICLSDVDINDAGSGYVSLTRIPLEQVDHQEDIIGEHEDEAS